MNKKKKILIIGTLISPLIRERVKLSEKLGYEILVLDFNMKKKYELGNIKVKTYFDNKILSKLFGPFLLMYNILTFKPDIIHVHWALQDLNTLVLIWFKNLIVSTMGSDIMPKVSPGFLRKFFLKLLFRNAKIITVKSSYMKNMLSKLYKIPDERISIIKWGLDKEYFKTYKKEDFLNLKIAEDKKIFFCSRAMQPLYRKKEILEAFIKYKRDSGSDSVLIISKFSANDIYLDEIERIIDKSIFKNDIYLIDGIEHKDMTKMINYIDYVIMYPLSDGMPQSLYESLAFGKFIIVPDLEHYKEILIHKKNAYFANDKTLVDAFSFAENKSNKFDFKKFNKKYARYFLNQEKELLKLKEVYEK